MDYSQQSSGMDGQAGPAVESPKTWFQESAWADYLVLAISLIAILAALYFAFL
ncbi:MAG: hypothetical protein ACRD2G_07755 [Terriglobia bacterium]